MNSRSSVNESNLVSFSPDLATLNSLDKEPLLSFPFDHLYACHSQSSDCGQSLTLDKDVEISTHCLVQPDQAIHDKDAEILTLKNQNKKLKELLVYHLDLIQQQNDVITNREKSANNAPGEAANVLAKLDEGKTGPNKKVVKRIVRKTECVTQQIKVRGKSEKSLLKQPTQRHPNPPPLFHIPASCSVSGDPNISEERLPKPVLFNTIDEILGTKDNSESSYLFNTDRPDEDQKPFVHEMTFDLDGPDALSVLPEYPIPAILENTPLVPLPDFNMIERPISVKKEPKPLETQPREPNYTITTNSGLPVIHKAKNQKSTGIGSLSRMPKTPKSEPSTIYDNEIYNVNKKAKNLNTYGKQTNSKQSNKPNSRQNVGKNKNKNTKQSRRKSNSMPTSNSPPQYPFGPSSNRLQLIDTTPTGEDPYQIGEAEMREQSPIPRLMLSKNNRVRVHTGDFENLTSPTSNVSRRVYDPEPPKPQPKQKKPKKVPKAKSNRRKSNTKISSSVNTSSGKASTPVESQNVKKEDLDWEPFSKKPKLSSMSDFSYGGTPLNLPASSGELVTSKKLPSATLIPSSKLDLYTSCNIDKMQDISKMSYNEIFDQEQPGDENVDVVEPSLEVVEPPEPPTKKRGARTTSLAGSSTAGEDVNSDIRRSTESKRGGRKRASSSASTSKREKAPPKPRPARGRGGFRGKRGSWVPVPALTTRTPYHTALGHPDISWYLGHDPDVKKEDVEQLAENTSSNVEVPRWREKIFTSLASAEGTESTDDEVYRKRHQKLEAEERRQLRWHMRRVREQRHVERLRLRQRDPWTVSASHNPPTFSVWPSPLRDLQLIEITDIIPVLAFGEDIPKLPDHDFVLPWVRTSKAQKRSKRSKTLQ